MIFLTSTIAGDISFRYFGEGGTKPSAIVMFIMINRLRRLLFIHQKHELRSLHRGVSNSHRNTVTLILAVKFTGRFDR
jgi:hypothetical protein